MISFKKQKTAGWLNISGFRLGTIVAVMSGVLLLVVAFDVFAMSKNVQKYQYKKIQLILTDTISGKYVNIADYSYNARSNPWKRFRFDDEYFGNIDIVLYIQKDRIGLKQTMKVKTVCNGMKNEQTYRHGLDDSVEYKYSMKYGNFELLIKSRLLTEHEQPQEKIDDWKVKISGWALEIARTHHIDTMKRVHAGTDPYVMAFCDKVSNMNMTNCKAILKNADLLIRQDSIYYIVQSSKIKQITNKPVLWIHAWDECTLTIKNGKICCYNKSSISPIRVWNGKKMKILIKDNKVENVITEQ